ncbi:MAG: acetyl-CoA carboxylase biotin carboxyl carrier protein [Myxococcota bacterium]
MATRKNKATPKKRAVSKKAPAAKTRTSRPPAPPPVTDPKSARFERILGVFNDSGLAELEYEDEELAIKVARYPSSAPPPPPPPPPVGAAVPAPAPAPSAAPASPKAAAETSPEPSGQVVTSPFVGTFYRSPSPEAPPFAEVGQRIAKGQTLCIIEAMKLMNEIPSDYEGVVTKVLVNNGDVVQYGDGLFEIGPG